MNFYSYRKAENSPGKDWNPSGTGTACGQPPTLTFSKFGSENIELPAVTRRELQKRAVKGILLKR